MKRTLVVLVTAFFFFSLLGCSNVNNDTEKVYSKPVVVLPDEETAYSVNGYKNTSSVFTSSSSTTSDQGSTTQSEEVYNGKYFGNKNSKKFHKEDCRYAKNMKEENLILFDERETAITTGYNECSVCKP